MLLSAGDADAVHLKCQYRPAALFLFLFLFLFLNRFVFF